jgi:hypothetical protein
MTLRLEAVNPLGGQTATYKLSSWARAIAPANGAPARRSHRRSGCDGGLVLPACAWPTTPVLLARRIPWAALRGRSPAAEPAPGLGNGAAPSASSVVVAVSLGALPSDPFGVGRKRRDNAIVVKTVCFSGRRPAPAPRDKFVSWFGTLRRRSVARETALTMTQAGFFLRHQNLLECRYARTRARAAGARVT